MAKISYRLVLGILLLFNMPAFAKESFEHACVTCHSTNIPDLEMIYFRYLQTHGSTKRSQKAMRLYLLNPTIQGSTLPPQVLKSFGLHPPLSPALLDQMLPLYFERYDVKKRIQFK
ncbi:MAG: hypothetical protein PHQ22_02835 [Sulfuricurvum sp.]|nr:hypothetical protein [Sulfuricurvum sp.]